MIFHDMFNFIWMFQDADQCFLQIVTYAIVWMTHVFNVSDRKLHAVLRQHLLGSWVISMFHALPFVMPSFVMSKWNMDKTLPFVFC